MIKILLIALIVSLGHGLEPKNNCMMPAIPMKMQTNADIQAFNVANNLYRSCVDAFIKEHKENADTSIKAANDAVAEVNKFVKLINDSPAYQKNRAPSTNSPVQAKTAPTANAHIVGHADPTQVLMNFGF